MRKEDIIGVWKAAGQQIIGPDGKVKSSRGADAPGYIMYTPEGRMMVVTTRSTTLPQHEPEKMTDSDKARCADACVAYSGLYEVRGDDVWHHVDVGLFPAWTGKSRLRHAKIEGKRLIYITEPDAHGDISHIFWERS